MKDHSLTADRVVDLLQYKKERRQRRLDFDADRPPRPALALVTRFRPLSAREAEHRQAMFVHLAGQKAEVRTQK